MTWLVVLEKMVMLVLLMVVGFGCAKAGWVDSAFSQKASRLVMNVFIVCTIISSVANVEPMLSNLELLITAGSVFLVFFLGAGLGWLGAHLLRMKGHDKNVGLLSVFFMNNVFIGFPVVEALFGKNAIFCASLTNLPFNLLLYSIGTTLLRGEGKRGRMTVREIFTMPMIATLAAVVIFLFQIPIPALVADTLSTLGAATVPMSMIIVGISLSHVPVRKALLDGRAYGMSLVRLILCPVLTWLVLGFLLPPGMELVKEILIVISACPSAAMITILCVRFGKDDQFASKVNFLSTVLCAVTMPVITYFLL
ncbi:MAG: AEC family transporter [Evtepia sp.]|uniref:AEC family transporter n=1 Tax=Evtepia sp. TaxID=2773933 RepID=UPI002A7638F7|nr:AEC family transporter [Evtepia sp.]MDY3014933.1 AEC family transporter [Evtepia sp.]